MTIIFVANVIPLPLWERVHTNWNMERDNRFTFPMSFDIVTKDCIDEKTVRDPNETIRVKQVTMWCHRGRWHNEESYFITPLGPEDMALMALWGEAHGRRREQLLQHEDDTGEKMPSLEEERAKALADRINTELMRQYDSDDNKGHFGYFGSRDEGQQIVTIDGKIDLLALAKAVMPK